MKTYIALLRGINVSGQKKILMSDLKVLFEKLGYQRVQTYIQSGNVVFSAEAQKNIAENISDSIKRQYGWEAPVLAKKVSEIEKILTSCPFSEVKKQKAYFTLLHQPSTHELISKVNKENYPDEEFVITSNCVYFFSEMGYGRAKCNNNFFERKLNVTATTRNYKTMIKLISLATN